MQIQPFEAVLPDLGLISSADHFFSTVKEKFNDYWESGYYKSSPQEGLYICSIQRMEQVHVGLIACVDTMDYLNGNIKRHENTLAASEQEQILQLLQRSAHVKPVMLTYRKVDEIEKLLKNYMEEQEVFQEVIFETNNEIHRFWKIEDAAFIQQLQSLFEANVSAAYIADGHHRTSSNALLYRRLGTDVKANPFRWLPCALFPTSEVEIYDFNRIIQGLTDFSAANFMARLSKIFEIEVLELAQKPTKKHELTLFLEREWYRLTWREEVLSAYKEEKVVLDVSLLNEKVLGDILGVQDVRTDTRVKYIQGVKTMAALREKTLKAEERFAFCLYPVSIEDFLKVADADDVLPPKSTWFEPRVRSGLLVRRFETPPM